NGSHPLRQPPLVVALYGSRPLSSPTTAPPLWRLPPRRQPPYPSSSPARSAAPRVPLTLGAPTRPLGPTIRHAAPARGSCRFDDALDNDSCIQRYTAPPPPRLLRRPRPRLAVASRDRPVPRLGFGGHAPADARRDRNPVLRALDRALPDAHRARRRVARRRAQGMGAARRLLPRPQPPPRRRPGPRTLRRRAARRRRHTARAPRHRRLHRRRDREHRLRDPRACRRWQRAPRTEPAVRSAGPIACRAARTRRRSRPRRPPRRLQPGPHGARRHGLHTPHTHMRRLPPDRPLPRPRRRHTARAPTAQARQPAPRMRRRHRRRRLPVRPLPHDPPPRGRASRWAVGISRRGGPAG